MKWPMKKSAKQPVATGKSHFGFLGTLVTRGILTLGVVFVILVVFAKLDILPFEVNVTKSYPRGVYYVHECDPKVGDLVTFTLEEEALSFAHERGYVWQATGTLLKKIAAGPGDEVCWENDALWINGREAAAVQKKDSSGRPFPKRDGCILLDADELLLLRPEHKMSFDGRVFGPIKRNQVRHCASAFMTIER